MTLVVAVTLWSEAGLSAQDESPPIKRVLVLFVLKQGMPWPYYLEESMRAHLTTQFGSSLELNVEYADQSRFPEKEYRSKAIDLYRYKYSQQQMDRNRSDP